MKTIKGIAVTEKGAIKAQARETIKAKDIADIANALAGLGFELVAEKGNIFSLERQDSNGKSVYSSLTFTLSTTNPADKKERSYKPKAKAETETIEIE